MSKKEWLNPELKNLSVGCTNEEVECNVAQTMDGLHIVGKCHHGLYPDNSLQLLCCPHRNGLLCTYKKPQPIS